MSAEDIKLGQLDGKFGVLAREYLTAHNLVEIVPKKVGQQWICCLLLVWYLKHHDHRDWITIVRKATRVLS